MPATGPDFISLQVRDPERSAEFYEQHLGLVRARSAPPGAVLFETTPIPFAVREIEPGGGIDSGNGSGKSARAESAEGVSGRPGSGIAIWIHATDVQAIHDRLVADGHEVDAAPVDGPFGRTFAFFDLDGYRITLHDRA